MPEGVDLEEHDEVESERDGADAEQRVDQPQGRVLGGFVCTV